MENFKLSFTDNTTYAGKDAEGFFSQALLTGDTKSKIKLVANVKSTIKLADLNLGNVLQASDCSFSNTGEGSLAQKSFSVEPIKINLEFCARTFETNYLSEVLRPGSNSDQVMPSTIEEYILGQVAKKVSADTEKLVWQGSTATASYPLSLIDGLEKQFTSDSNVIDVAATSITSSNVIAELTKVYNAIPEAVMASAGDRLRIFVAPGIYRAYRQALANASAEVNFMQNYSELSFLDVRIEKAEGLTAGRMVAASLDNLILLTDLMSDFEDIQLLNMKNTLGQSTIRFIAEMKLGVGYMYGSEVVFYS